MSAAMVTKHATTCTRGSGSHQDGLAAPDNGVVDVGSHLGVGYRSPGNDVKAGLVTGQPIPAAELTRCS